MPKFTLGLGEEESELIDLSIIYEISEANSNMSDVERLTQLYAALSPLLAYGIGGDIVEVGCNAGHTAAFLQLVNYAESPRGTQPRQLHVFDSFQGLPASSPHDRYLLPGDLAVNVDAVQEAFSRWGAQLPTIHAGWFSETLPRKLPAEIAFAYIDCDYYESVLQALSAVVPRLAPGGVLIVDDYCDHKLAPRSWGELPGVKKACDDFFGPRGLVAQPLVGVGDLSFALYRRPFAAVQEGEFEC